MTGLNVLQTLHTTLNTPRIGARLNLQRLTRSVLIPRSMPPSTPLEEFALIQRLAERFGTIRKKNVLGIGDDAAVILPRPDHALLTTTDLMVEGIHFDRRYSSLHDIGYKAMVRNLSDIAAMGGVPKQVLTSIAIPRSTTVEDVEELFKGIMLPAKQHGIDLIGGDTAASPQKLFLSITLMGEAKPGGIIRRAGAGIGDEVFVTGTLGDSRAGLDILQRKISKEIPRSCKTWLTQRHLRPTARILEGQRLARYRLATAMIDLSDGLSGDLRHVCDASGVGAHIHIPHLPLSNELKVFSTHTRRAAHDFALHGGEDYELLFTVKPEHLLRIRRWTNRGLVNATHIGTITPKRHGLQIVHSTGIVGPMPIASYQHFRRLTRSQPTATTRRPR